MILNQAMPILGPVVLVINFAMIFMCLRPKYNMLFTILAVGAMSVCIQAFTVWLLTFDPPLVRYLGIFYVPLIIWIFNGQAFQKLFAFFIPVQLTILTTHIADALVGATLGYASPHALAAYLCLSLVFLSAYVLLVRRFARGIIDRLFVGGGRGEWALYAFGSFFSFMLILTLEWTVVGVAHYFSLILFILWSIVVLCYTIINTHEKTAQTYYTEALLLQMKALREQTDTDKMHLDDIEILRHDMRHEMGVIMELFRTGKPSEAEAVYAGWQDSLNKTAHTSICAEPVLNAMFSRFERRARDMGVRLYVNSDIPDTLPIDAIKLSVMVSNALENALAATGRLTEPEKRVIRVKLILDDGRLGLEVINPCTEPVEFDLKGLPVTHEAGHGIGVRSIAAFAEQNGFLLDFSCIGGKFAVRLLSS